MHLHQHLVRLRIAPRIGPAVQYVDDGHPRPDEIELRQQPVLFVGRCVSLELLDLALAVDVNPRTVYFATWGRNTRKGPDGTAGISGVPIS
jgi:hypothetical protein